MDVVLKDYDRELTGDVTKNVLKKDYKLTGFKDPRAILCYWKWKMS